MPAEYVWVRSGVPPKCKLSKWKKDALKARADEFVAGFYKAEMIKPPPVKPRWNYVVDCWCKWQGPYLKFTAKYACPRPNALSPFFEHMFARMGYFSDDNFSLWARRHNDEWMVLEYAATMQECFDRMRTDPWFHF